MDHKPSHVQRALSGRLEYFNKSAEETEFHPSQYYYNREDGQQPHLGGGGNNFSGLAPSPQMTSFGGVNGGYAFQQQQQQRQQQPQQQPHQQRGVQQQMPGGYGGSALQGGGDVLSMLSGKGGGLQAQSSGNEGHKMGGGASSGDFQPSPLGGPPPQSMANALGGGNRGAPFDMSDFPALAGGSLSMNQRGSSEPTVGSFQQQQARHHYGQQQHRPNDSTIALSDRMHQALSQQSRRDYGGIQSSSSPRTNSVGAAFAMQSVDFPALPGSSSLLHDHPSSGQQQQQSQHVLQIGKGPGIVDDLRGSPSAAGNHHHQQQQHQHHHRQGVDAGPSESLLASLNSSSAATKAPSPSPASGDLGGNRSAGGGLPGFSLDGSGRQQPSIFGALGTSSSSPGSQRHGDNAQAAAVAPGGGLPSSTGGALGGSLGSRPGDIQPLPPHMAPASAANGSPRQQQQAPSPPQMNSNVAGGDAAAAAAAAAAANNARSSSSNSASAGGSSTNTPTTAADAEKESKYGLLGLLDVIRMTNADLNTLSLGSDLTTLGLNLNSSECLYSTFASPWAEAPTLREPQFSLPLCYYMQPPPLKTSHLTKFQLETLFYVFYAMPKDVLQSYAAQELYNREWQYHPELKLWFKRGSPADGVAVNSNQFIYFDINSWECRIFFGNNTPNSGAAQPPQQQQQQQQHSHHHHHPAANTNAGQQQQQQQQNPPHGAVSAAHHQVSGGGVAGSNSFAAGLLPENDVRVKFNVQSSSS